MVGIERSILYMSDKYSTIRATYLALMWSSGPLKMQKHNNLSYLFVCLLKKPVQTRHVALNGAEVGVFLWVLGSKFLDSQGYIRDPGLKRKNRRNLRQIRKEQEDQDDECSAEK